MSAGQSKKYLQNNRIRQQNQPPGIAARDQFALTIMVHLSIVLFQRDNFLSIPMGAAGLPGLLQNHTGCKNAGSQAHLLNKAITGVFVVCFDCDPRIPVPEHSLGCCGGQRMAGRVPLCNLEGERDDLEGLPGPS